MAAGNWKIFDKGLLQINNSDSDLDADNLYCMLLSSSYSPDKTDETYSDISSDEIAQQYGYTTGGVLISNLSFTQESNGDVWLGHDNITWSASGGSITARYAVIYNNTLSADSLICQCVLDSTPADVTATDGNDLIISAGTYGIYIATTSW